MNMSFLMLVVFSYAIKNFKLVVFEYKCSGKIETEGGHQKYLLFSDSRLI